MTLRLRQTTLLLIAPVILAATLAGCARTEMDMASRPSDPEQDRTPSEVEVEGEDSSEPRTPTPSGSLTAASEPAPAATQSESITLTLTAAATCETEAGRGGFGERVRIDADGNRTYEHVALGLYGVAETPVQWSVTGGTGPYTLVIDGEARDARREYKGRRGTASVSCALETGDVYFGPDTPGREVRRYRGAVVVDSGLKAIRATVTDGEGRTAETSIDVYVILDTMDPNSVFRAGQTYRIFGHLLTIPEGIDLRYFEQSTGSDGNSSFSMEIVQAPGAVIWLDSRTLREIWRPHPVGADAVRGAEGELDVNEKFDELMQSLDRLPAVTATAE